MPLFRTRRTATTAPETPPAPVPVPATGEAEMWLRRHGIANAFELWRNAEERHIGKLAFLSILQDEHLLDREPGATTRDLTRQAQDYAARASLAGIPGLDTLIETVNGRIVAWRRLRTAHGAGPPPAGCLSATAPPPSRQELIEAAVRDFPTIRSRYRKLLYDLVDDDADGLAAHESPLDRTVASGAARFIAQATRAPRTVEPEWLARRGEVLLRLEAWARATGRNPFVEAFVEGCVSPPDVSLYLTDIKTCMVLAARLPGGTGREGFRLWTAAKECAAFTLVATAPHLIGGMILERAVAVGAAALRHAEYLLATPDARAPRIEGHPPLTPHAVTAAVIRLLPLEERLSLPIGI